MNDTLAGLYLYFRRVWGLENWENRAAVWPISRRLSSHAAIFARDKGKRFSFRLGHSIGELLAARSFGLPSKLPPKNFNSLTREFEASYVKLANFRARRKSSKITLISNYFRRVFITQTRTEYKKDVQLFIM